MQTMVADRDGVLRAVLQGLRALKTGDASIRLPPGWTGLAGKIAAAFNDMAEASLRRDREMERARGTLEDEAVQLARASRYKSDLIAEMGHELRTPLNSLLILSDRLAQNREGNLSERQVDLAETIHASGTGLLDLIDDLLDLSRIEAGAVAVDVGELHLDDLFRYLERTFRPIAEARDLEFELRIDPRLPDAISTDARRLQQILVNLLSNGFKFTHRGRVTLTVEPAEAGWSAHDAGLGRTAGVVAFRVDDTGIGIAGDKHEIVFEAFRQADGSISRAYAGTGLGLAIARELATLLGGEIGLTSSPGSGASFTLYLPMDGSCAAPPPEDSLSWRHSLHSRADIRCVAGSRDEAGAGAGGWRDAGNAGRSRTTVRHDGRGQTASDCCVMTSVERADILVVDDRRDKHLTYRVVLEDLGQNIVSVASGGEALRLLQERDFAVVLLDVNMPGMSGLETAAAIRSRRKSRHTPIIFVTAFADDAQTAEGYALGAVDYILTPIVPEILRAKVKVFVELWRMRAELARSHALLERRVADRTAELEETAERLRGEVLERRQAEERLVILVQELTHRVKNLLSVFQSIASRTLTGGRSLEEAHHVLMGRLQSLGHAHELLTEASWQGAELCDVVKAEIAGFSERVRISGPSVALGPSGVQTFALIVHELCTNAAKYGALSNATGEVLAEWTVGDGDADGYMEFSWQERGGPPVAPATYRGFGLSLIGAIATSPAAEPAIDFAPGGFLCKFRVPLSTIMPNRYDRISAMLAST